MRCPYCQHEDTQVMDTRASDEGDSIRRRRRCNQCDKRFTTYERIELTMPVIVKKNGSRSEFEHAKLRGSLMLALRKRPVSADAVDAAVALHELHRVERQVERDQPTRLLQVDTLGEDVGGDHDVVLNPSESI